MQTIFKIAINAHLFILYKSSSNIILGNGYELGYFEKNVLETFDKATNLNPNLNDLDDDFEYLFLILLFPVHDIGWGPSANIINEYSTTAIEQFFNILFDIESIASFYAMGSNFSLTCYYFEKHKNSSIKDNTS